MVRNPDPAASATVKQPLPLPQGVSNLAVGTPIPGTPEPSVWLMLGLSALGLGWLARRRRHAEA